MITFPPKYVLANLPTPIQLAVFDGKQFLIKRDDFTGMELTGNKVRKLEYLLADAIAKKAELVVTCGGEQSNHARATAAACARLGIACKLFLWGKKTVKPEGNLFLDSVFGAEIEYLSKKEYFAFVENPSHYLNADGKNKAKPYFITEGGSDIIGIMGYVEAFSEMAFELKSNKIKRIVVAAGTGGTAAGLLLGAALCNLPVKIAAVNVLYNKEILYEKIRLLVEQVCEKSGLLTKSVMKNLVILDGYSEEGYKQITDEKMKVIASFAKQSGIILDPVYTGKAFFAFQQEFLKNHVSDTLFLHTGGLFGVFPKKQMYI
ncbi:MAG: pyridoxal-phosphate dependent enzyme [Ignavibacteriales bacterium]|nr:pyridoxal-phosphate dependent enzyme [Ignavibacteriales bacterium]